MDVQKVHDGVVDGYLLIWYCVGLWFFFFFFSSRRRHTRSLRDWSSDVCSSDLIHVPHGDVKAAERIGNRTRNARLETVSYGAYYRAGLPNSAEIGRASCRERV